MKLTEQLRVNTVFVAYTYLIGWRDSDVWYYGSRKSCKEDIWKDYFTSSKIVPIMRKTLGEPDVIRVHKRFNSYEDAVNFETKFLVRVNAVESDRWLNMTDNLRFFNGYGDEWRYSLRKPKRLSDEERNRRAARVRETNKKRVYKKNTPELTAKQSAAHKNKRWYYNPTTLKELCCHGECPEGFVHGRSPSNNSHGGHKGAYTAERYVKIVATRKKNALLRAKRDA
jgi:hypothetical protein